MIHRFALSLVAAACFAQAPGQPLRVTVNLVQVDAVVTDKLGRQVTHLTKDDFELFEDGKPRQITHFSYVRAVPLGGPVGPVVGAPAPGALRREDIHRSIALVVDDLRMSFESMHHTRETLRHFVDYQLQPDDLAAIITTSGGNSALQQFTADRRVLHAGINRLRFQLASGGQGGLQPLGSAAGEGDPFEVALLRQRRFNVGTMGSMRLVAQSMANCPGASRSAVLRWLCRFPQCQAE